MLGFLFCCSVASSLSLSSSSVSLSRIFVFSHLSYYSRFLPLGEDLGALPVVWSRVYSLTSEILIFSNSMVCVCLIWYKSLSSMWSILSEELAARIRIPFRIVMTSSVFRLVFRNVFRFVVYTI